MPDININDEHEVRLGKLAEIQKAGIDPYPATVRRSHRIVDALTLEEETPVIIAGRIRSKREMGKLIFCHLDDGSATMQVVLKSDSIDAQALENFGAFIDIADFIEVSGTRFKTQRGEESVLVSSWRLLSKALRPLPDKFHGLQDDETRYRKRYLDFIMNPESRDKMIVRGKVLRYMREFLYSKGFDEVETPVLETVASGAMARTFDTYLNAFDLPVHLRICLGELWQKRLLVGGFEKTFEIGRAFRNEGVDHQHNPEFTMIEYYWAYADAHQNMELHQEMIPFIIKNSVGDLKVKTDGHMIDFTPPYPVVTFRDAVLERSGIDISDYPTEEGLRAAMKEKGYETEGVVGRGKLMDNLYKETTRPFIIQPTFVMNYPVELKPLAKKASDPMYTDMFQLIVNGFELSNSYTELNDPVDQRARFEEQARDAVAGDDEAMNNDWDYVEALEHGMPPATGTGIGIDRFVALITGSHTLREIMAFPLMKPVVQVEEKE